MIGLIGGTGLGEALTGDQRGKEHDVNTPFGKPSSPVRVVQWHGLELAVLARHGDGHTLNPAQIPYQANMYALKNLGVTHVIASGAVGSLRDHMKPGDLVVVDQIIDKTYRRVPTFYDEGLAVHVEMSQPYCGHLRRLLNSLESKVGATVHEKGTYVCMEGPAFSSTAESHMHRDWGGDVIGMTAMPEAKLAREAEICYASIALITDYDCWRPHDPAAGKQALLSEIMENLRDATANAIDLMQTAIAALAERPLDPCACQSTLDLAVWTNRDQLTPAVRERYGPLLQRYLTKK